MSDFVVAKAFEDDHRAIDERLAQFKDGLERGEWLGEPFRRAAEELRHHIYVEEEVLFPFVRTPNLFAAMFVMFREHVEIWQSLDDIEAQADGDYTAALAALAGMQPVLESHNSKEEQIIYSVADSALSAEHAEAVRTAFEEGKRPQGWLPQKLRQPAAG